MEKASSRLISTAAAGAYWSQIADSSQNTNPLPLSYNSHSFFTPKTIFSLFKSCIKAKYCFSIWLRELVKMGEGVILLSWSGSGPFPFCVTGEHCCCFCIDCTSSLKSASHSVAFELILVLSLSSSCAHHPQHCIIVQTLCDGAESRIAGMMFLYLLELYTHTHTEPPVTLWLSWFVSTTWLRRMAMGKVTKPAI